MPTELRDYLTNMAGGYVRPGAVADVLRLANDQLEREHAQMKALLEQWAQGAYGNQSQGYEMLLGESRSLLAALGAK